MWLHRSASEPTVGRWRAPQWVRRAWDWRGGGLGGLVVAIALAASGCGGVNEAALQPITKEPPTSVEIPPVKGQTAAFDYLVIDQDAHRLYISDLLDHGVDVVDVPSPPGRYLQTISLGTNPRVSTPRNPQGITFASDPPRLFTANDDGTVS